MYKKIDTGEILTFQQVKQLFSNTSFAGELKADNCIDFGLEWYDPPPIIPDPIKIEELRISLLWKAAHDYEYKEISGSAIGLLAIGVINQLPKCLAVQNWIKSIWTEYYIRKANGSNNLDFTFLGSIPYTVPELMDEMGL